MRAAISRWFHGYINRVESVEADESRVKGPARRQDEEEEKEEGNGRESIVDNCTVYSVRCWVLDVWWYLCSGKKVVCTVSPVPAYSHGI